MLCKGSFQLTNIRMRTFADFLLYRKKFITFEKYTVARISEIKVMISKHFLDFSIFQ